MLFFLGGKSTLEREFGPFRTSQWESNFEVFLLRLRDFMLRKGFGYDSFAIYPFDEYIGEDFIYVAQVIRNFDPKLKIYANKWIESESQFRKVKGLIDIWCPGIFEVLTNKNQYDRYQNTKSFGHIWCYSADLACERYFALPFTRTAKEGRSNIKTFWRTMPITSAYLKMNGAGFWVYQDANGSGWTKDKFGYYGVVYDGSQNPDKNCIPEAVVPSKRWQQWREGIEDAVCLSGHQKLLDEFFLMPSSQLNSEYFYSLRKRADQELQSSK
jgi:hypothetical protein